MDELSNLKSFNWQGSNDSPGVRPHVLPVDGFEDYLIRGDGVVFSMKSGNIREKKHVKGSNVYRIVSMYRNGKATMKYVHRLVAEAFIANPNNKPQVNHRNGDVADNRAENLEWVTASENHLHAYRELGRKPSGGVSRKKIECVETRTIYNSIGEAERLSGVPRCDISNVANGRQLTAKGFRWRFV